MRGVVYFLTFKLRSVFVLLFGLLLLISWLSFSRQLRTVPVSVALYAPDRVVVIDPGHGGIDPGAVSADGILEKEVTLGVALQLERLLQRAGMHVVLTRRDDRDLADPDAVVRKSQDLERRVRAAEAAGADLFISIHANSFPSPNWSGAQTFYYPGRSEDQALAERIQQRLVAQLGPNRRQAAPADYYVLRNSKAPAVVVEVGFLSNPRESRLLASSTYQQRLAEAIYLGIVDYFTLPAPAAMPSPR